MTQMQKTLAGALVGLVRTCTVHVPSADTDAVLEWMGETHRLQSGVTALLLHA